MGDVRSQMWAGVGSVSHYPGRVRPLLPAVVAALVAPVLPVLAAAPAGAANDQDPRTIDKRTVDLPADRIGEQANG